LFTNSFLIGILIVTDTPPKFTDSSANEIPVDPAPIPAPPTRKIRKEIKKILSDGTEEVKQSDVTTYEGFNVSEYIAHVFCEYKGLHNGLIIYDTDISSGLELIHLHLEPL
jgi:hypothetical protein